jgi:hypothetical protein
MTKEIIIVRSDSSAANVSWLAVIVNPDRHRTSCDDDDIRHASLSQLLELVRARIEVAGYDIDRVIVHGETITGSKMPGFFDYPRTIYPSMFVMDDLYDDVAFALMRLAVE